jgi:hypothetical protein
MSLCTSCQRLKIELLPDPIDDIGRAAYTGFHHSTAGELLESAQRCPLCAIIKDSFLRVGNYHVSKALLEEQLNLDSSSPVLLRAGRKIDKRTSGEGAMLSSVEVLVNQGKRYIRGRFHLYAPKGEISSLRLTVRD